MNNTNKQNLIDLISAYLIKYRIQVVHALEDGDADITIIKEAIIKSANNDYVIVHSVDTDIFVGLIFHSDKHKGEIIMKTKKGPYSTTKIGLNLDKDIKDCLLFAHAISGCDTVSAVFGLGKVKAYRMLLHHKYLRQSVSIVGQENSCIPDVINAGEMFLMQLYGKIGKQAHSLDNLREIIYMSPNYIPIERMPPTSRAFYFFMLRVHMQVNTWMYLKCSLDPMEYGFEKDKLSRFKPIITDKEVAPSYLLQKIKCSCNVKNKFGQLCIHCSCVKKGFVCTPLCKCYGECENNQGIQFL